MFNNKATQQYYEWMCDDWFLRYKTAFPCLTCRIIDQNTVAMAKSSIFDNTTITIIIIENKSGCCSMVPLVKL